MCNPGVCWGGRVGMVEVKREVSVRQRDLQDIFSRQDGVLSIELLFLFCWRWLQRGERGDK